jgi:hypothetical protein
MRRSKGYEKDWLTKMKNSANYDAQWRASMPYPTNPFSRVDPKELMKLIRQTEKSQSTDRLRKLGDALL